VLFAIAVTLDVLVLFAVPVAVAFPVAVAVAFPVAVAVAFPVAVALPVALLLLALDGVSVDRNIAKRNIDETRVVHGA
jgi:hypothetical protein